MKKVPSIVIFLAVFISFLTVGGLTPTPSSAATTKILSSKMMISLPYKAATKASAYVYNSAELTSKAFNLQSHPKTTFYVTKEDVVQRPSGSHAIYYYIKNSTGTLKGYVWHGFLKGNFDTSVDSNSGLYTRQGIINLINKAPDMDPSGSILDLNYLNLFTYSSLLSKSYNLERYATTDVFKNDQAKIYVADAQLLPTVQAAINQWNAALSRNIFSIGTKDDSTITVQFGDGTDAGWAGAFSGNLIQIDQTSFNNPTFGEYFKHFPASDNEGANSLYWQGIVLHELGHAMGLAHTGYMGDVMGATASVEGTNTQIAKYQWKDYLDGTTDQTTGLPVGKLSSRDIHRALLARNMGYW